MPLRKVHPGNSQGVEKSSLFWPAEEESEFVASKHRVTIHADDEPVPGGVTKRPRSIRDYAIDIINGFRRGLDGEDVNGATFHGWKMQDKVCIGSCSIDPNVAPDLGYVAITRNLIDGWTDAWLKISINHIGVDDNDWLFEITEATLESSSPSASNIIYTDDSVTGDLTLSPSSGVYSVQIATTNAAGIKVMTTCFQQPAMRNYYKDERLAGELYNEQRFGYSLFMVGYTGGGSSYADSFLFQDSFPGQVSFLIEYGGYT